MGVRLGAFNKEWIEHKITLITHSKLLYAHFFIKRLNEISWFYLKGLL